MADKKTTVDPRYMKYNKDDVERILGSVEHVDDTPVPGSKNPITSGSVAEALDGIQERLAFASEDTCEGIVSELT